MRIPQPNQVTPPELNRLIRNVLDWEAPQDVINRIMQTSWTGTMFIDDFGQEQYQWTNPIQRFGEFHPAGAWIQDANYTYGGYLKVTSIADQHMQVLMRVLNFNFVYRFQETGKGWAVLLRHNHIQGNVFVSNPPIDAYTRQYVFPPNTHAFYGEGDTPLVAQARAVISAMYLVGGCAGLIAKPIQPKPKGSKPHGGGNKK